MYSSLSFPNTTGNSGSGLDGMPLFLPGKKRLQIFRDNSI
jgi:hypothetical protein